MPGGTELHPKRSTIDRVRNAWDLYFALPRDVPAPSLPAYLRQFWDLISEVMEGRREVDFNPDNMFRVPGVVLKPKICVWL